MVETAVVLMWIKLLVLNANVNKNDFSFLLSHILTFLLSFLLLLVETFPVSHFSANAMLTNSYYWSNPHCQWKKAQNGSKFQKIFISFLHVLTPLELSKASFGHLHIWNLNVFWKNCIFHHREIHVPRDIFFVDRENGFRGRPLPPEGRLYCPERSEGSN